MLLKKISGFIVSSVSMLLLLSACNKPPTPPAPEATPYHALTKQENETIANLQHQGLQVIRQGDRLWVILPTDYFFQPGTTKIRYGKEHTVLQTAKFVKQYAQKYPRPLINVSAYTDKVYGKKTRLQLSRDYARVIASYLWREGINQSQLIVRGFGARNAVAGNRNPRSARLNRRVVIQIN